ncbi:MAG TPA: HlyD family secretion protein [Thermoanaerobaculia bacterium]|nr:HlyD family secretion protein [Thermoanaerobaculia bacterium]
MTKKVESPESDRESGVEDSREKTLRPAETPPAEAKPAEPTPRGRLRPFVLTALLVLAATAGLIFGIRTVSFYRHHVETDDAQVEAHIAPVLPKVSGYVTEVAVEDNQRIKAGQTVVRIDDRDFRSRVETARGALENAKATVAVDVANVAAAQTQAAKTVADLARYARLREREEVSQQQYDAARAASEASAALTEAARRSVQAARAQVAQKQADLDLAELQLSYTTVTAPSDGFISKKSVEVGQFVQAGEPLLAVVSDQLPWVVANFKETQLKKMRVGQPVEIDVDAYPRTKFHGRVESIAAATGAKFALLPPDNATGNFTKVVQRVPVKIVLTDPPRSDKPLRAGMSVNAIVAVD